MMKQHSQSLRTQISSLIAIVLMLFTNASVTDAQTDGKKRPGAPIGKNSKKILVKDGKMLLWAGGDLSDPEKSQWYDFTDAAIPAAKLQFGIGKDLIQSIDDPVFVKPDDARLAKLWMSWNFRGKQPKPGTVDELRVMGYVIEGEARAYPAALLNRHELVNDKFGDKPVTVGW